MLSKLAQFVKLNQSEIILGITIAAITVISFNLGKISALNSQKAQIRITNGSKAEIKDGNAIQKVTSASNQAVVASKNSKTKLYHFSWCPGASQIAEKNKIIFINEAAAIAAGYKLAGNCRK